MSLRLPHFRPAVFALAACLWACELSTAPRDTVLSLRLDDSLSAYDSIRVDILYPDGKPYKEAAFHGRYAPGSGHALSGLDLGSHPPSRYQILITAYRDTAMALVYAVPVGPEGAEAPHVLVRAAPPDTGRPGKEVTPPLRVAMLTPSPLLLSAGAQATQARAEVQPPGADPGLAWSSSDTGVVRVDGGGMLFPGAAGEADVTARSRRDPALYAVLRVKVAAAVKPRGLTLTPNQAVLYMGGPSLRLEAVATPAEAHAMVVFASLDTAVARVSLGGWVTAVAPGSAEVIAFPAGEPSLALSCRITVTRDPPSTGPKVSIQSPADGSLTNASSVEVAWTEQAAGEAVVTHTDPENLSGKQGAVAIVRAARDAQGQAGADTVVIYRDTIAPAAPAFTGATAPELVNAAYAGPVQWAWTPAADAEDRFQVRLNGAPAVVQPGNTFILAAPQNQVYVLEVREVDAAGNVSPPVSRTLAVDRLAPPPPSVKGLYGAAGPAWEWSPGPGSDGTRAFRYRLSPQSEWSPETAATAYAPADLPAGSYTLQVEERDAAGNWSEPGASTLTGP